MKRKNAEINKVEEDTLFSELQDLVNWFAHRNHDPINVMMSFDDIKQELEIELVKGIQYYRDKPISERRKLVKTMLDHRIGELRHRFYKTHRGLGNGAESIDTMELFLPAEHVLTELDSKEYVESLKARLSPTSRAVLDVILVPNDSLANVLTLSYLRAVRKRKRKPRKPWYIPKPHHVAEVLGIDVKTCRSCFEEIKSAYLVQ